MIAGNQVDLILGAWRSFLFVAIAAGLIVAARQGRLTRTVLAGRSPPSSAVDLWSVERLYWLFSPRASVLYASDTATEWLQKAPSRASARAAAARRSRARELAIRTTVATG